MVLVASQLAASPFFKVNDLVLMLVLGSHSLQAPFTYLQLSAVIQNTISTPINFLAPECMKNSPYIK